MLKPKYWTSRINTGLLLTIAVSLQVTALPAQAPSAGSGQAIPIAILDFEANGISQTEAIALTDRLRNELFRLGEFEVVERGMMEDILLEQDFQLSGCTTNDCLVEVGRLMGARQVVGGRISKLGAMFTVSARVVDVETGKLLRVSDYDLRGGLEEMLTVGMKQVAVILSGGEVAMVPMRSRPDSEQSSQPASGIKDDQRRRTWSINVGLGSSRNANLIGITKDVIVGNNFSLYITGGLGGEILGIGIAYQQHYNEKGFLLSVSVGPWDYSPFEFSSHTLIAYQWTMGLQGFLVTGAALAFDNGSGEVLPYPVLSYEYRY